ncbi:MAG: GrpB family protein [Bdellovibrionales bacterium]|nr:GrpB family protein [Bdellovibrionales bacterium]
MDFAVSIEHVGSTSVLGLAAKPVIDMDIIIPDMSFLEKAIERLRRIGYEYRGNLGIVDREAFKSKSPLIKHNLYVCPQASVALKNHICLRDTLRAYPNLRDEYSSLKQELALKYPDSIDDYVEGKTDFILKILARNGLSSDRLEEIRKANLAPKK